MPPENNPQIPQIPGPDGRAMPQGQQPQSNQYYPPGQFAPPPAAQQPQQPYSQQQQQQQQPPPPQSYAPGSTAQTSGQPQYQQPYQQPGQQSPQQPPATYPLAHPSFPAPTPAAKPAGSRYDFFLETQPKPKKPLLPAGRSRFTNVLLAAGLIFGVLIILAVALSALRGGRSETPGLTTLTTKQQDIIRTSDAGLKTSKDDRLQDFAATANTTTLSAQQELIAYVARNGGNIDSKKLAAGTNPRIDQVLTAAQEAGTYDTAFTTTMRSLLTDYIASLQKIRAAGLPPGERALIDKNLAGGQLLLTMLGA